MLFFWSTDGLIDSKTAAANTRRYFRCSRCTIWSWMSRCQSPLTIVPRTRIRIPDLLGDPILYLIDRYQVRHRIHLHTTGFPTTSGLPHISQHGGHDHRDYPGPYICLCKLQACCRNLESGTVSLLPTSRMFWRQLTTVLTSAASGTCQKMISLQTVSYIVSAIQMATDWVCAAIPCFIVAGLQMSRRRKISVIAILGLGVSASVATCVRMPYLKYYDTARYPEEIACKFIFQRLRHIDTFANAVCCCKIDHLGVISITSNVECCLGIIACSLPPLRKLFRFYYGTSRDQSNKYTGEVSYILDQVQRHSPVFYRHGYNIFPFATPAFKHIHTLNILTE